MSPDGPASHADSTTARLVGWKEISAYLRRSIRTVQRWERESALPVRRYPTKRGEGVFALPEELDAWLKSAPGTAASQASGNGNGNAAGSAFDNATSAGSTAQAQNDSRATAANAAPEGAIAPQRRHVPRRVQIGVAILVVIAIATHIWFVRFRHSAVQPATARVVGNDIVAFDAVGNPLWKYALEQPMQPLTSPERQLLIEDLDGDGSREVIVALGNPTPRLDAVVCLNADGTKRWSRRPDRRAQYGFGTMGAPWVPLFVKTTEVSRHKSLWVSWANSPFFAAFVERLDVKTGEPKAVYWSAGYVEALAVTELRGRPVLLLGGCSNEHRGGSLAVYDLAVTNGSAPAADRTYACSDCPAGRPLAFYVFPKTAFSRAATADTTPLIADAINVTDAGVVVNVQHAPGMYVGANALYRFDRDLHLLGAETVDGYRVAHRELEHQGKLAAPWSEAEERQLFPVLSWDGRRFVEVTPGR